MRYWTETLFTVYPAGRWCLRLAILQFILAFLVLFVPNEQIYVMIVLRMRIKEQ